MKPLVNLLASVLCVAASTFVNGVHSAPVPPPAAPAPASAGAEPPDGSPSLPRDTTITHATADTIAREPNAIADGGEERIESRLAIIRNGRATITDPNVGRYDRAAASGQRRVAPTMWQVFRF